jgi:hypothetical protein
MLKNTFCHIPGISVNAEFKLWSAGLCSWDGLDAAGINAISSRRRGLIQTHLEESHQRLTAGDVSHFADRLASAHQWRLFPEFRASIAYLDIETTGLSPYGSHITTIALYDGQNIRHYVHGENLEQFGRDIGDYSLFVTYNGKCFDIPFIREALGLKMEQAHIDLRHVLKSLGYSGGLKGCEKKLGLDRGELEGVDGFFAVLLWQDYLRSGNPRSLETLLAYNIQDVVNLETLLVMAYNLKIAHTPFADSHRLPLPKAPQIPFKADREVIDRLKRRYAWSVPRW